MNKEWIINQEKLAEKFKLSFHDIHNLYDLFYMINWQDYNNLKLNKMDKWFKRLFEKLEEICLDEGESK